MGFGPMTSVAFAVAGDVVSVTMQLAVSCPSTITPRATVSVRDPNNATVPLVEGEAMRDAEQIAGQGMQTVVKVRAVSPGPYHFTARFEPNLGIAQRDVIVAENRRDAGASFSVPAGSLLTQCRKVDVSAGGKPLCMSPRVEVYDADGGVMQTLSSDGGEAVRAGNVLWLHEGLALSRWVETPTGFAADPDAGPLSSPLTMRLAADEHGLFFAQSGSLSSVEVTPGGTYNERTQFNAVTTDPQLLWKHRDEYLVLGGFQFFDTQLCSGRFNDAGRCDSTGNFGTPLQGIAAEPAGLWTWFADQRTFPPAEVIALRTGPQLRELTLPSAWHPTDAGSLLWDTGAMLRSDDGQTLLLLDRQGAFVLQQFPDRPVVSLTSQWVTLRGPSGEVLIYRR